MIEKYALSDEQALLAKLRYNRLVDILSIVQIIQDYALCQSKFTDLICRPIAAQFMANDLIALFEFEQSETGLAITVEKHYKLVAPDQLSADDLSLYQARA